MRGHLIADRYELEREVGRGGMGTVWKARDRALQRPVALKLMAARHAHHEDFRRRFSREATALAQLHHPHIVAVHDYGIDNDCPYMVMELLAGEDLRSRLMREKRLSPMVMLEILRQVGSGLAAAAAVDIVHRDLKPANIFLARGDAGETVKILDFGVAWSGLEGPELPEPGRIVGTPAYMSPEQVRGIKPHHVGDLWSLAVIAYKALTGELPFSESSFGDLVVSICTDAFPPVSEHDPSLPAGLDAFFERALTKDSAQRFPTAAELIAAFALASRATRRAKVLIVDDEPDVKVMMKARFRRQLAKGDYEFLFADNGEVALERLRANPDVDVVLADIHMPVMDGLALLERIPEVSPFAKTVIVSAFGQMPNIRRAMNRGAFDFVIKPIDFKDLAATLDKTVQHVFELRDMAGSGEENQLLRKFTPPAVLDRLLGSGPALGLANDQSEGTVVFIEAGRALLDDGDDAPAPPGQLVRRLNAIFEVVIPELEARGGDVSLIGSDLLAVFTGDGHTYRSLEACRALFSQSRRLASTAGPESPYAKGVCVGVATGPFMRGCVGSQVCGRLSYLTFGEVVDQAKALARSAEHWQIAAEGRLGEIFDEGPWQVEATSASTKSTAAGVRYLTWCEATETRDPIGDPRPLPQRRDAPLDPTADTGISPPPEVGAADTPGNARDVLDAS
ncbi:serine/threonine protein kinase/response regulator/adenylate cyclase [Plesiocystis pacifica SIR-1]|uniref:Serine/threonine protein kinase/response regulator/adenylate cyclase n=1 Tax=Plesiocystis pacifica SIR-1 TaxID=391625 RepID=A6G0W5_9BACT|nr:protein kinase [Plesiocystis pacifica]EDM80503.1 serine/threonine protein kinase/response regulator/adenylate cyclase [Plesiocystis pacifica SIR-1]